MQNELNFSIAKLLNDVATLAFFLISNYYFLRDKPILFMAMALTLKFKNICFFF